MKKLAIMLAFALAATAVIAAISEQYVSPFEFPQRYGVERVTHYDPRVNFARIDATVHLEPTEASKFKGVGRGGYAPYYQRATARIHSRTRSGFPRASVTINTKDLPAERVYEVWLVDADSGYRLSLGTFVTLYGGVGELFYQSDRYLDAYDTVEITEEPFDDFSLAPGPTVLVGLIPEPRLYDPVVKQPKMLTSTYTII